MSPPPVTNAQSAIDVDLLVLGGGMAGMTAAAFASRRGLCVGVVEKASKIGGSALLSGGGLLKPADAAMLKAANPGGEASFADLLCTKYDDVIEWITSLGVPVTPPASAQELVGIPCSVRGIDIVNYIALCRVEVESAGGWVVTDSHVTKLETENDTVVGALVRSGDELTRVRSPVTLLATGGFQGSSELRRRYLGEGADAMLVRANPNSVGDGLGLGLSVGATTSAVMDRFYGHTIPAPLDHDFRPGDFVRLSMPFMVTRSLLLDKEGRRFVDESLGYYSDAQAVLHQPGNRALLIGDQALREADVARGVLNRTLGFELVDRPSEAAKSGARVCERDTIAALDTAVAQWGYRRVGHAVIAFNQQIERDAATDPPRIRNRRALVPPLFAMEVQPAVTFTFGGLRVDGHARVVRTDGRPITGLFAAGADVGGFYCEQYCGGLGMAAVLAMQAVEFALSAR